MKTSEQCAEVKFLGRWMLFREKQCMKITNLCDISTSRGMSIIFNISWMLSNIITIIIIS